MTAMIDQQAMRLLATSSPSNATAVMGFMTGWLGLDRLYTTAHDDTVLTMSKSVRDAMNTESQSLIMEAFNGGGSLGSALTADHTFLNSELATFYGLPTTGLSTTFKSVSLAGSTARDPGLLATGTILNGYARPDTSSPTQRGHMVRSRMLCQDVNPPPPNLDTTFHPSTTPQTTRQRFEQTATIRAPATPATSSWTGSGSGSRPTTASGATARPRTDCRSTAALTVFSDPQGKNVSLTGLTGTNGLASYLAASDDVKRCMLRYWSYYAYGASSWSQDACTYDGIYTEASSSSFALKSTLMAIIHAKNFTQRVQDQ